MPTYDTDEVRREIAILEQAKIKERNKIRREESSCNKDLIVPVRPGNT
jgi:hypothetical protein